MRRSLNKALEAYGVDPTLVHPHLFRSTVGTAIAHGGFSVSDASKVLGHSASAVTEKYYIEELRSTPDVTAALDALVGEWAYRPTLVGPGGHRGPVRTLRNGVKAGD